MMTLIKIDLEKRMFRWYSIGIQNTLVDGVAVIYGWGSLKSNFQQWRTIHVRSKKEAEMMVQRMLLKRKQRGYVIKKVKANR